MNQTYSILLLALLLTFSSCQPKRIVESEISGLRAQTLNIAGETIVYEEGWLSVPETHEDPLSNTIKLPFRIIRTDSDNPLPPIFLLEGGPANNPSIMQQWEGVAPSLKKFTSRSDIIVLEQRGNGGSIPNLQCPGSFDLPLDKALDRQEFARVYSEYIKECEQYFSNQGIKTSSYHVISMSHDLEKLRQLLGYNKVFLFGGSFGSHWALNYLKLYPNTVERILIDSPEGFDHTRKLPSYAESALSSLGLKIERDSIYKDKFPDLYKTVKACLEDLEETRAVSIDGEKIILGKYDLQLLVAQNLGRAEYRALPKHFQEMSQRNYDWLARHSLELRKGLSFNLLGAVSDCTSGCSKSRIKTIEEEAETALLGDALNNVIYDACDQLNIYPLSQQIHSKIHSDVPMLVAVGDQDARTPVRNANEILSMFSNGHLIIIENGSHDIFNESGSELFPLLMDFLTIDSLSNYTKYKSIHLPLRLEQ